MNVNMKVHAAIKLNGQIIAIPETELKHIPIALARILMESNLSAQQFSTCELRISKRAIHWDSKEEDLIGMLDPSIELEMVEDDSSIDDKLPKITYSELMALNQDPIWIAYVSLKREANVEAMTSSEYDSIVKRWKQKYAASKFARLV
jgi:hypothetical protein